jgi:hypothetical protein
MPRRSSDAPEEKFKRRRPQFFRNGLKNARNPASNSIKNDSLHERNLLNKDKFFKEVNTESIMVCQALRQQIFRKKQKYLCILFWEI